MFTSTAAATAEIVTIGDELLRGEIVDTNAAWIGERLTDLGFHVRWSSSTTDQTEDIVGALAQAALRARVIVTSGGCGPTEDDRTVDAVCALTGLSPVLDEAAHAKMTRRFAERGFAVTPNNLRQVRTPAGADVIANAAGLAPGFRLRLDGADLFVTPGVPREMQAIWNADDGGIEERLRRLLREGGGGPVHVTRRRTWRVAGLGESHVDHRLRGLLDGPPPIEGASLHFRIAYPETLVTVVAKRADAAQADAVLDRLDAEIVARLGEHAYGQGRDTLAAVVGRMLRARGETLAAAESCTGGLFGDLVTDVPGSSRYFRGAIVAYANEVKVRLLGVSPRTLAVEGAVSETCVREMALGVRDALAADWGVAISGLAGPDGGSDEKPVGLLHFGVAGPAADGPSVELRRLSWPNERRMVKQMAAQAALFLLYRQLAALR